MTIEEKAKAYDGVREKIAIRFGSIVADEIFSQFEMSEDERIRQFLIHEVAETSDKVMSYRNMNKKDVLAWLKKQGEQKPILDVEIPFGAKDSELEEVSYHIPEGFHAEIEGNKVIIKKGEQNPAWSEEDDIRLNSTILFLKRYKGVDYENTGVCIAWLKSIKDRVGREVNCTTKEGWSEEDEKKIDFLRNLIRFQIKDSKFSYGWGDDVKYVTKEEAVDMLKSLRPQSTWKPSDEQMHYLSWIANVKLGDSVVEQEVSKHLNELYEDLLKLKE